MHARISVDDIIISGQVQLTARRNNTVPKAAMKNLKNKSMDQGDGKHNPPLSFQGGFSE